MRIFLNAALAALSFSAVSGSANASTWECKGPAASCATSAPVAKRTYAARTVKHTASHKTHSAKRVASSGKSRSSGGGSRCAIRGTIDGW